MTRDSRIFVAGHRGLIGSALVRRLTEAGYTDVLTRCRTALDLADARQVDEFFAAERPQYVFLAAGRVGGIEASRAAPAEFIRENLAIQTAVLHAAYRHRVTRLIFFGSACMYPRDCVQPMAETALLTGSIEPTSASCAIAKLAGLAMCEAYNRQYGTRFLTVIPASVYGPGDDFDPANAHVLAALIGKFHCARPGGTPVVVWGTGAPRREFIHVDDLADACLLLMSHDCSAGVVNVGVGEDIAIRDLTAVVRAIVAPRATVDFDRSRPEGAPCNRLDSSRIRRLGWVPRVPLADGIARTYQWYREHIGTTILATAGAGG
jgi:GDP-L-fucose synthase